MRRFLRNQIFSRASADRKRCGVRSSQSRGCGCATKEEHTREELRRHRGDTRRLAMTEVAAQVVGRAPLRRRWGLRPGEATMRHLAERPRAAVMDGHQKAR